MHGPAPARRPSGLAAHPVDLDRWRRARRPRARGGVGGRSASAPPAARHAWWRRDGNPLAVGELRAAREDAPTVLIYGHYDVQSVGDPAAWTTPPFEPDDPRRAPLRARRLRRQGQLPAAAARRVRAGAAGALPVNVRVLVEGEEEAGGEAVAHWIRADERGADCAIVFDSGMVDERHAGDHARAARASSCRTSQVRTAERDLHSGVYGGSALNALHVLHAMLAAGGARPGRAPARRAARGHRARRRRPSATPGRGCRPATRCSPTSARGRPYPGAGRRVLRAQRRRRRRSTSTPSRAASRARSCRPWRTRRSRCASPRGQRAQDGLRDARAAAARRAARRAPRSSVSRRAAPSPRCSTPDTPAVRARGAGARARRRRAGRVRAHRRLDPGGRRVRRARHPGRSSAASAWPTTPIHAPDESFRLLALDQGAAAAHELYRRWRRSERGHPRACARLRGAYCRIEGRE